MKIANALMTKAQRIEMNGGIDYATNNTEPSMTQVADASETNINIIMAKYQKTGQLPRVLVEPLFGDFTEAPDYRQAVEAVNAAHEAFMEIPAKIRMQFGNDPQEFIKFCADPNNKADLDKWGLTEPPKPATMEEKTLNSLTEIRDALKPTPKDTPNGK